MEQNQPAGARILVVDDEPGMREGCKRVLSPLGHSVDTAPGVVAALDLIEATTYDLALIDVMMPDGNGIDLIEPIHRRDPDSICIIITAYASIELAVEAIKEGAYDFISKPFNSDQLIFAVDQGLERQHLRRQNSELDACRRRAEELEQARAELEKLERMKSQFMLVVAHELRAPVAAIQSYINLILAGYVSETELQPTLARAQRRLQELLDLIADLLELARLKEARDLSPADTGPQPVADVLDEVVDLLRQNLNDKEQTLDLEIQARPIITANRAHLRQIWMNLVSNAIKYTPRGGRITIRLRADDGQITGVVEDTGMGISKKDVDRLFQEFFRTNQAKASGEIGTGLGLAIVKQIVASYHGTIGVESEVGQGSRFTFTLPLEQRPARPEPTPEPARPDARRPLPAATHARILGLSDPPRPAKEP